ncbi:phospholipase D gamma 1-like protein [Tanacetum coccineum]
MLKLEKLRDILGADDEPCLSDDDPEGWHVQAIRSAQHFIYIENQYFIGSSYNWKSYKDLGANKLIPMEISLKVASKIRAHARLQNQLKQNEAQVAFMEQQHAHQRERLKKQREKTKNQKEKLESLCRSLQIRKEAESKWAKQS